MNITKRQHRAADHAANLRRRALPLLIASCFAGNLLANPLGPQVVNGQANFVSQGNTLSITNTPGAIINWQNFSINPGELTRFLQQNPNSAVLNRVTGGDPSAILGALQSNGKVFLINPNGILFGQGAQVDVNGLVASTLHLSNDDFLLGRMNFQAGSTAGRIQNQGAITTPSGGQVLLIAPNVENSGIITSPKGEVLLAAGHTVQLVDSANPDLHVVLSAPDNEAINLGQIIAQGGKTGIYGALIHQRGIVNANSAVVGENGRIVFKASRDTILDTGSVTTATGEGRGGDIEVLGDRVGVAGGARIDASGKTGGGAILVGGDYHGENAAVANAKRTYVGSNADIKADAKDSGNGGKVIVWSDEVTRNYGNISARGGAQGGDGGFVESSGKQTLEHHAAVNVAAPKGKGGTLLLDPATITIVGGTGDGNGDTYTNTFQGSATAGTVNFADSDLTSAGISNVYQSELEGLAAGTNIVLEATDYIGAVGSFTGAAVSLPSNSNLTMRTRNASGDGAGGINLVNSADSSNLAFQTQGTGTITLQTGTGASPQAATIDVGTLRTAGGTITVNASGNVVLRGAATTPGGGNGGDISLTSGGYMTLGGAHIDARGSGGTNGNVTLKSGDAISLQTGKTIYGNQLKMTAATGIYGTAPADAMTTQVSSINALNTGSGPIRISNSGSNLSIADIGAVGYGVKNLGSGGDVAIATSVGEVISVNAPVSSNNGAIYLNGLGGINVYASTAPEISSSGGAVSLYSSNPDTKIGIAAATQIDSAGGSISMTADHIQMLGAINAGAGNVTLMPSAASAIKIGSGANSANITADLLELGAPELANIATSGQLLIQGAGITTLDTAGSLDLKTPGKLTGSLSLLSVDGALTTAAGGVIKAPAISIASTTGAVTNNAQITADSALTVSSSSGAVSNSSALTSVSGNVGLYSTSGTVSNTAAINAGADVSLISTNSTLTNSGQVTAGGVVSLSGKTGGMTNSATLSGNQAILTAGSGTLTNTGAINVTSSLQLNATAGDILNSNTLSSSGDITISAPVGQFTNSGNITAAGPIFLTAQKMSLVDSGSPTINSGSGTGFVLLSSDSDIDLGSAVDTNPKLELSTAELGAIHTGILRIDSTGAGVGGTGINISSALTSMSAPVLDLVATGNITQAAGKTIDAVSSLSVKGASVNLPESNNVGVIAGTATTGDFIYRSLNQIAVDTVHAQSGITVSQNTGTIKLKSDTAGISQAAISNGDFAHPNAVWANGGGLVLEAAGDIKLLNTNNNFGKIAVNLNTSNAGIGKSMIGTASSLDIASLTGVAGNAINGINTNNTTLDVETSVADSAVTVNQAIAAGTGAVRFKTDGIALNNSVTASSADLRPYSPGRPITVGSSSCNATLNGGCLTITNLYKLVTPMVGIGTEDTTNLSGDIYVAGITVGGSTATDRNAATTRIGLLSGGGVSQAGGTAINVQDLGVRARGAGAVSLTNSGNAVANLAGKTDGGSFSFADGTGLSVFNASGTVAGDTYSMPGVNAGTGTVQLMSSGAISGPGTVTGGVLVASAAYGISLGTSVSTLAATNTGASGDIAITNSLPLTLDDVKQTAAGGTGAITIDNTGALTVGAAKTVSTASGAITLTAHSPLNVNGTVQSTSGPITLTAGASGQTTDQLTIAAGATVSTGNTVTLVAGDAINIASGSTVAGSTITQIPNQNTPPAPPPPSLSDCVANPNLSGCSTVLPTLADCTTNSSLTGCSVVLPSLSQCTATPTLAGCTAVLPTLSDCTATPTLSGCTAVLPTLSDCTTNPTLAGCTAVLPTLSQCTATPTLSGCTAVLPTLSDCMTNPTLAGCTAVLPTLSQCTATPTLSGCTAVLPTLSDCTTNPALAGCTAVLPTLSQCTVTPTLSGCSAVLPTLSQCTATPTLTGCTAVLPTITQCTVTPTLSGCGAVLPSLASCTTSPTMAGCSVVLPTLSVCTTSPATAGCTAVLPSLATCTATPATAGCSAVLPTLDSCVAAPVLAGCSAVLPTVSQCTSNSALTGCAVVLPSLANCTATPTLAGCSAVLPSIDQCTANLSLAGCTAVLPTIAQCTTTPTLAGCSVVMPAASLCTLNPSLPECTTVLPPSTPASTEVVTTTITSTINTVVTTSTTQTMSVLPPLTSTTSLKTPAAAGGSASPSPGGSSSTSSTSSTSSASDGSKSEDKKDERKDTAGPKDEGVKKNEPAKKMYCN